MKPIRTLVVGVDADPRTGGLTRGSRRAVEVARWLAERDGRRLELAHSTRGDRYVESGGLGYVLVHEGLPDAATQELEDLAAEARAAGLECAVRLSDEKPAAALAQIAGSVGADLIVVGKHERDLPDAYLGSEALRTIRESPVSVWVASLTAPLAPRSIVAATDLLEMGARVLAMAAEVARRSGAEVHVAHAFQIPMGAQMESHGEPQVEALADEARRAVREQVDAAGFETEPRLHVGCTTPVRGLLSLDRQLGPDLTILGTTSRTGVSDLLLGHTAERVLTRLARSILVLR